jgi:hypothetical protein
VDSLALFQHIRPGIALGRTEQMLPGSARKVTLSVTYDGASHPLSVIVVRLHDGAFRV